MRPYKVRDLSFKKGVLTSIAAPASTGERVEVVLKYALDDMHVANVLPCCDSDTPAPTHAPVAWNIEEAQLEWYNAETGAYEATS